MLPFEESGIRVDSNFCTIFDFYGSVKLFQKEVFKKKHLLRLY